MNKKKLLALLMALVMTLTLVPVTALAEGDNVAKIGDNEYATLADAIAAVPDGTETTITMIANSTETADSTISVAATKNIVLDLNGKTVTGSGTAEDSRFLDNRGTLTVKDTSTNANGKITFSTTNPDQSYSKENITIYNIGGNLTLLSGTIENTSDGGATYAVNNSSNAWGQNDDKETVFNMSGGTLSAPAGDAALRVYQNCAQSATPYSHNTVTISGGTILDTGIFLDNYIYQPNANTTGEGINTSVTISGGTINGLIDLKLRHAFNTSLTITGGDFNNARLWVRKHGEWNNVVAEPTAPLVTISGGKWSFVTGKAFGLAYDCGASSWTSYTQPYYVTGGVFNVDLNNYSGIVFESGKTGVANTAAATKDDYPYTVGTAASYVAQIGDDGARFETLDAAVAAANPGETVKLLQDITYDANHSVTVWTKAVNLNLNSHTLTTNSGVGKDLSNMGYTAAAVCYSIPAASAGNVRISNGTIVTAYGAGVYADDPGLTLTLEDVTINAGQTGVQSTAEYTSAVRITGGAHVIINSGSYSSTANALTVSNSGGDFTVNGGTFSGKVFSSYGNATAKIITINGGKFSGTFEKTTGSIVINGGVFSDDAKTAAASVATLGEGKAWANNPDTATSADYPHTVGLQYVAQIGETKYATLAEAFEHAQDNDKIILLTDTSVDSTITVGSITVELDLNGHVVTNNAGASCRAFELSNDTNFTVTGTTAGSGMVNSAAVDGQTYGFFRIYNKSNATLTVNGGTYTGNTNNGAFVRVSKNSSNSVVNLTNVNVTTDWAIFDNTNGGAVTLTMTGGTYTQNNVVNGVGNLDSEGKPVGAIHVTSRSNLVMDGVMLTSMGGTGVAVESQSTGTLTGCSITITGTENAWASCAVGIGGLSTVTLDGGTYTSGLHGVSYYTSGGVLIVDGDATITGAADGIAYFYDTGYYSNLWKDYFPDGVPFYTNLIDGTINKGLVSYNNGVTNAAKNDSVLVVEGGKINGDYTVGGTVDTYDITGGKFTANPSAYVADGYEAVSITNEAPYTHQVGKVKATETTKTGTDSSTGTETYQATKSVVDTQNETNVLSSSATVTVKVTPTKSEDETTDKAAASLDNIKDMSDFVATVTSKTGDANEVNVTIQVAKSDAEAVESTITYEVHPEAIISVEGSEESTTVELTNDQITGTFTFKLNVSALNVAEGAQVNVVHKHADGTSENMGTFVVDSEGNITLTVSSFSEFDISQASVDNGTYFTFEGASLRRRVLKSNTSWVVNTSTDIRFGYLLNNYDTDTEYYFQWSTNGTDWSSAIEVTKFGSVGTTTEASLVITNVPSASFGTTIYTRIYAVDGTGTHVLEGDGKSVNNAIDGLMALTASDANNPWIDYAKFLHGGYYSSYTLTYEGNTISGYSAND